MQKTIYDEGYRRLIGQLKTARCRRGWDQVGMGRLVERSRQWVSKVERCEIRVDALQLVTLCRVLEVDASRLVAQLAKEESSSQHGDRAVR